MQVAGRVDVADTVDLVQPLAATKGSGVRLYNGGAASGEALLTVGSAKSAVFISPAREGRVRERYHQDHSAESAILTIPGCKARGDASNFCEKTGS